MPVRRIAFLTIAALACWRASARAQDPLSLYPENYTLLFENDRVRVLDFRLRKGATETAHRHPAHVAYVLAPMKIRFTLPDGSTRLREAKAGEVLFSEAVTHASENIGDTDAHGILLELEAGAERPATPAGDSAGLTAVTFIDGIAGQEDDLVEHLLSLAGPTRAEPGNRQYDLYRSVERPSRFVRLEQWTDANALEVHKAMPYMRDSFARRQREGWTTRITLWRRLDP